jgi:hypothetical protein
VSERSGGSAPPSPTPTDGSGDDIYATAAASSAGRSHESRRPTVRAADPSASGTRGRTDEGASAPDSARHGEETAEAPATSRTADPDAEPTRAVDSSADTRTAAETEPVDVGTQVIAAEEPAKDEAKPGKRKVGAPRGTRRARLRLSRLDPWSVMKTAFMFSIAAGIVLVVAVYAVWLVIGSSGLFESIDSIVGSVLQSPSDTTPFRIGDYINTQKVMGVTAFLACVDVVIFTALATLASFLYNLAAVMLGGLEVTLAED